jgi:hypothetical protein
MSMAYRQPAKAIAIMAKAVSDGLEPLLLWQWFAANPLKQLPSWQRPFLTV